MNIEVQAIHYYDNCVGELLEYIPLDPPMKFHSKEAAENYKQELMENRSIQEDSPVSVYFTYKQMSKN